MTRLLFETYLDHLRTESGRFRETLADTDPAAPVPTCPGWTAADLLWHLGEVQWFWSRIVGDRPQGPDAHEEPPRPSTYDGLLEFFDRSAEDLVAALGPADPAETAWTWSAEQTVGFTFRRQAHEALIHRLDAELAAAGSVTDLPADLAADGVQEVLDVMYGGCPPWGTFTPIDHWLRVDLRDTDQQVWVQLGQFTGTDREGVHHDEPDIQVVEDPGREPDTVIEGTAGAVDAWLWRRGDDEGIHVAGDRAVYDRFRVCVDQPIE